MAKDNHESGGAAAGVFEWFLVALERLSQNLERIASRYEQTFRNFQANPRRFMRRFIRTR